MNDIVTLEHWYTRVDGLVTVRVIIVLKSDGLLGRVVISDERKLP